MLKIKNIDICLCRWMISNFLTTDEPVGHTASAPSNYSRTHLIYGTVVVWNITAT